MLTDDQVQDLLDTNDKFNRRFFIWCMDEDNDSDDLQSFFDEELVDELEEAVLALMIEEDYTYDEAVSAIDSYDWRVLTDQEATDLAWDYTETYVDDALREIPDHLHHYFNADEYREDQMNDRGAILASYNGEEREQEVNGTIYYLYKC
jgi:hypothetical protein